MEELIARLQAAECGSRELDGAIAAALGLPHGPWEDVDIDSRTISHGPEQVPAYTTNLQDASEIMPEGWRVTHAYWDRERAHFTLGNSSQDAGWRDGDAATPALAMTAASLRARSAA